MISYLLLFTLCNHNVVGKLRGHCGQNTAVTVRFLRKWVACL